MSVGCSPALEGFDGAFAAVELVTGVYGEDMKDAGADGGIVGCRFDDDTAGRMDLEVDDIDGVRRIGAVADAGFEVAPGKVDL